MTWGHRGRLLKASEMVSTSIEALNLVSKPLQEVVLSPQAAPGPTSCAVHEAVTGKLNEVRLAERAHGGAGPVRLEAREVRGHTSAHGAQWPSGGVHVANVDRAPSLPPGT